MKWFLALNESGALFARYADMVKVAVHTAMANTTLVPHLVYDGKENDLTAWLRERKVPILACRSYLYDQLAEIARRRAEPLYLAIGAGAFLRAEIPTLAVELGIDDTHVVYTDCDVMFLRDVDGLSTVKPRVFAVAPEHNRSDWFLMNSGVMVMNLTSLREDDARFRKYVSANLDLFVDRGWDQAAYAGFYTTSLFGKSSLDYRLRRATRWLRRVRWDRLAPEYNWKPYWGHSETARIIHFHGPKPYEQQRRLRGEGLSPERASVENLATGGFEDLCELWFDALSECEG